MAEGEDRGLDAALQAKFGEDAAVVGCRPTLGWRRRAQMMQELRWHHDGHQPSQLHPAQSQLATASRES
jgi:hypothetical protein